MTASRKKVAVLGFHDGNAGQVAEWFEAASGLEIACYVEEGDAPIVVDPVAENKKRVSQRLEYPTRDSFKGLPLLVCRDWPERLKNMGIKLVLPLTTGNADRLRNIERCREAGLEFVSAVHPSAIILDQAVVAPGCWINAGCIVGYKAELAAGVMLNTGAQVDHHNVLETCCQLDPGVVTAGHVTVRRTAQIHTGAVIINRVEIGEGAIVGAGAVVLKSVAAGVTVAGVPARLIPRS